MKKPKLYRKLASAHKFGVTQGGWESLHLAPDHLLLRSSSGFVESYRRFYFADIEAITVCQTVRGLFWNSGFAFGLFVCLIALLVGRDARVVWGIFSGFFALLLAVNLLRGTTCKTNLQTRVQTRALPLRRQRKALRVIRQLTEPIQTAQAQIAAASSRPAPGVATIAATVAPRQFTPPPLAGELHLRPTKMQLCALGGYLISGCVAMIAIWQREPPLTYLFYLLTMANLGLTIAVLVQHRGRRLRSPLIPIAWVSAIGHAVALPVVYMTFSFIYAVQATRVRVPRGEMPRMGFSLGELRGLAGFDYVLIGYAIFALGLALGGLFLLLTKRVWTRESEPA